MSKLGLHIISWNHSAEILNFIAKAQPGVVKMMEFSDMDVDTARASSPGTMFVGRQFMNDQPLDNPIANAQYCFDQLAPAISKMGGRIDVWEGYNEVTIGSVDDAKRYNDFTVAWAQIMHSNGLKCAAYSFSTANPDLQYWQYLADGARACDYLALHEYDHPRMDSNPGNFCLRYRNARALLPPNAQRPILITECGIDDGQNQGWVKYASPDDYLSQLAWYDGNLMQDDYIIGATIFTVDGGQWKYFEVLPILNRIADYIVSHPTPPPSKPVITAVTFSPSSLQVGDNLNVSITVANNSNVPLSTQQPDPGFTYKEGETFLSKGFPEVNNAIRVGIDYDGRTGIDHPYRWGLGSTLPPGQSTTIDGVIQMNTPQSRNYWAGLVREQIVWLQDNQGIQKITVASPPPHDGKPTITAVQLHPTTLQSGQMLNVSITVRNDSQTTLTTQGPNPAFTYNEGDTFYTRGFPEVPGAVRVGIDFDGRAGIDHPFRWGLGAPLPPGQSVTVTGSIQLSTVQTKNYWAGLVEEQIVWVQDKQGTQLITVTGPPPPTGKVALTSVVFDPTFMVQHNLLQVTATIVNGTNDIIGTQGPIPGFVYNEGDNYLTKGAPPIVGAFRIGVDYGDRPNVEKLDHPYRWGFGGSIAPGQSAIVNGYVRLNRRQNTNYWVGLAQEGINWLQDNQGTTMITVVKE